MRNQRELKRLKTWRSRKYIKRFSLYTNENSWETSLRDPTSLKVLRRNFLRTRPQ